MEKTNKHIFISYTIRDGFINVNLLEKVKTYYELQGSSFVDLLDNDSINKQERVFQELEKSDLFVLLKTPGIDSSPWVNEELHLAKSQKIPIENVEYETLKRIKATNTTYM